jgi:hypothetical protein
MKSNDPLVLVYIRRKSDGLLSKGILKKGGNPRFTKYNKMAFIWNHPSRVRLHLSERLVKAYRHCEVVTITIDLNNAKVTEDRQDILNFIAMMNL